MDFALTEEQQLIKAMAHEFAQTKVAPIAAEIDQNRRFPGELIPQLRELNLFGVPFPEEYGGAGADFLSYVLVIEELAKACASTAIIVSTHTCLCVWPIYKFGNETQKKEYLPKLTSGEWLGAFGLTEPAAGTDAASMKTTAVLEGDQWVLNGSKIFITNGAHSDVFVIFALTDPAQGTRGISAFIVEKDAPGFSFGGEEKTMGIRGSSTTPLYFSNCRIPREALLGQENKGFKIAMAALDGGRVGVAAQAVGIAQGALDAAVAYAKERAQFGKPIAEQEAIQWMIADSATEIEAARMLVHRAAWNEDNGLPYSAQAAMAKLFASETASRVAGKAIQIHGGYGFTESYPVERAYRDAKITEIYEGTSEVQRMVISRNALN
ncbi:MAG: acyl-CoA dehydrogenase [Acidimicrobiales bacterium]|jgi:butyryl-CoA dehydrogenase